MREHVITSATFFQSALYVNSRDMTPDLCETLLLLSTGHLFGLYNPNQVADALGISKAKLYRDLKDVSLYQWKSLLVGIPSTIAIEAIRQTESKSAATRSRRCITISVDDTNDPRKDIDAEEFIDPNFGEVIGCDTLVVNRTLLVGNPERGHALIKANGDKINITARNRKHSDNFLSISVSDSDVSLELAEFTTGNRLLMTVNESSAVYSALETKDFEEFRRIITMGLFSDKAKFRIEDKNGEKVISTTD